MASIGVVESEKTKLTPSFAGDIDIESILLSAHMRTGHWTHDNYKTLRMQYRRPALFTKHITQQITHAMLADKRPVLVSMGTNAIGYNWARLSMFMEGFLAQYG